MSAACAWSRRRFTRAAAMLAAAAGMPLATPEAAPLPSAKLAGPRQRALLKAVSQLVIPRSGTPGAGELGVGDFVALALALGHGGEGVPDHVEWLAAQLRQRAGGDWMRQPPKARQAALAALDAAAFAPADGAHGDNEAAHWLVIKGLILSGYYTTRIGGAQELRFEFTPGRYDPDLPLKPGAVGLSSDWNAVEFG